MSRFTIDEGIRLRRFEKLGTYRYLSRNIEGCIYHLHESQPQKIYTNPKVVVSPFSIFPFDIPHRKTSIRKVEKKKERD